MRDTQGTVLPGHRNSPIAPSDQCLSTPGRPHDRHQWRPGARRLDFPDIRHADTRHPSDAPVRFAQARPAPQTRRPSGQARTHRHLGAVLDPGLPHHLDLQPVRQPRHLGPVGGRRLGGHRRPRQPADGGDDPGRRGTAAGAAVDPLRGHRRQPRPAQDHALGAQLRDDRSDVRHPAGLPRLPRPGAADHLHPLDLPRRLGDHPGLAGGGQRAGAGAHGQRRGAAQQRQLQRRPRRRPGPRRPAAERGGTGLGVPVQQLLLHGPDLGDLAVAARRAQAQPAAGRHPRRRHRGAALHPVLNRHPPGDDALLRLRPLRQRGLGPAAAAGAPQPGRRRGDLRLHARRPRPRRDPRQHPGLASAPADRQQPADQPGRLHPGADPADPRPGGQPLGPVPGADPRWRLLDRRPRHLQLGGADPRPRLDQGARPWRCTRPRCTVAWRWVRSSGAISPRP